MTVQYSIYKPALNLSLSADHKNISCFEVHYMYMHQWLNENLTK